MTTTCPSILKEYSSFTESSNSKLYSSLQRNVIVYQTPVQLFWRRPIHNTISTVDTILLVTIPSDLTVSNFETSVLAKGLKFIHTHESLDTFTVKSLFRRLRKKHFFIINFPSLVRTYLKESVFRSPPEDQYSSLELLIQKCRHDTDNLPMFKTKRLSNLISDAIRKFIVSGDLHSYLAFITPCTPIMNLFPKIDKRKNPGRPLR